MNDNWTELTVSVRSDDTEEASAAVTACTSGLIYIEDYSDMLTALPQIAHVDYIDDELLKKDTERSLIHLYLPEYADVPAVRESISQLLSEDGIPFEISFSQCSESDWANSWKQFYHTARVTPGGRLVVRPSWEEYSPQPGDAVLIMDPGSSFGSGTHETTHLCLEQLESLVTGGERVLDMGCGSGILAIAALLLGAKSALGVDIEENAAKCSRENAQRNGVAEKFEARCGNAIEDSAFADALGCDYDIICANIVADVLIAYRQLFVRCLRHGGKLLASGIIDTRADEVESALVSAGLHPERRLLDNGWVALVLSRP